MLANKSPLNQIVERYRKINRYYLDKSVEWVSHKPFSKINELGEKDLNTNSRSGKFV